jgi:hypothetical protein
MAAVPSWVWLACRGRPAARLWLDWLLLAAPACCMLHAAENSIQQAVRVAEELMLRES